MRRSPVAARPASRVRPTVVWAAAALCTLLAAIGLLPDLLGGLDRFSPFAQLVSFRPVLLGAAAVPLAALGALVWFRRGAWPFLAGLTTVLLVAAVLVLPRAVAEPLPTGGRPITVLSFNVFEGNADVEAFAELIRIERPDLIAVPEAGARYESQLAPLIEPLGYRLYRTEAAEESDIANVVAAVSTGLGRVRVQASDASAPFPFVQVTGGRLGELRFAAVHTQAPVPDGIPRWRADLAELRQWCAGSNPAIVAGDLNATLDHSPLREGMAGCIDAAAQRGEGMTPTWGPSKRARLVGPQIDHVLATAGIAAETFAVVDLPGSDHRAVLTRLRLPE